MTGPALAIVARCWRLGIILAADGDRLRFRPASKVDSDLRKSLAKHKAAIMAVLALGRQTDVAGHDDHYHNDDDLVAPADLYVDDLDRRVVAAIRDGGMIRPGRTPTAPGVPDGWTARSWRRRLLNMAKVCINPNQAAALRVMASGIGAGVYTET